MKIPKFKNIFRAVILVVFIAVLVILFMIIHKPKTKVNSSQGSKVSTSILSDVNELSTYSGKVVTIQGNLVSLNGNYYIAAVNSNKSTGLLQVDFSEAKINPAKYVSNTSNGSVTSSEVTITGQLNKPNSKGPYILEVQTIN